MSCAHTNFEPDSGGVVRCPDCGDLVWSYDGKKYLVPHFRHDAEKVVLCHATNYHEASAFNEKKILRTRLNLPLSGLNPDETLPSATNSAKNREIRFDAIKKALLPYGLMVTRFIEEGSLDSNEPFWIHRRDLDPKRSFPELNECPANEFVLPEIDEDPRWRDDWHSKIDAGQVSAVDRLYRGWRPGQKEAVRSILQQRRSMSIVSLPTGRGKSFIAQYCSRLLRHTEGGDCGPTLIISPLISLMDDQRIRWNEVNEIWQKYGVEPLRCAFLTAEEKRTPSELKQLLRSGELDVLCCSPEALLRPSSSQIQWIEIFQNMNRPFSFMVIDEAHTIADWGASIRPEFQLLNTIKRILIRKNPNCRLLLMSATITKSEEEELHRMFSDEMRVMPVIREIGLGNDQQRVSNTRPDLMFDIEPIAAPNEEQYQQALAKSSIQFQSIMDVFSRMDNWWTNEHGKPYNQTPFSSVLFTRRRKDAKKPSGSNYSPIHNNLTGSIQTYTGETSSLERQARLDGFLHDRIDVLVATSAFGMGVDKPNAWLVGYVGLPFTLKSLYQSFGRAARDSGWQSNGRSFRSGICFGRIFGKSYAFSPELQIKLSLERFWDFVEPQSHENGYMFLNIEHDAGLGWATSSGNASKVKHDFAEDALQDEYGWNANLRNSSIEELKRAEKEWRKKRKSRDAQIHFRMWLLSVLERVGVCSIVGVLREGAQLRGFKKSIEEGEEESNAFDNASNQPGYPPEKLILVAKIEQHVTGFQHSVDLIQAGIEILKQRHDTGIKEIREFRSKLADPNACRRQLLAPAIGVDSENELTCVEAFQQGIFMMPCNACRRNEAFSQFGLPADGPLVSSEQVVNLLRDQRIIANPVQEERHILPKSGRYVSGDEIDLLSPGLTHEGRLNIIENNGLEAEVEVIGAEGKKIRLTNLSEESWYIPNGKYYLESEPGTFIEAGDS